MRNSNSSQQSQNQTAQLWYLQTQIEETIIEQDKKEASEPDAKIYAFTKSDAKAGSSKVVSS